MRGYLKIARGLKRRQNVDKRVWQEDRILWKGLSTELKAELKGYLAQVSRHPEVNI